jgi:hypothetical protein
MHTYEKQTFIVHVATAKYTAGFPHILVTAEVFFFWGLPCDRLCGLVVRVPGYRSRGPAFDSRRYQIFWEVVGLERGLLSLMRIIEELLEWKK